jgi:hypothetical protein
MRLDCDDKPFCGGGIPITTEQQLLLTLWWLGKGELYCQLLINLM